MIKNRIIILFIILFILSIIFVSLPSRNNFNKYPFQSFYQKYSSDSLIYNIAIVSDMDKNSKVNDYWQSSLVYGRLERNPKTGLYSVMWIRERIIKSTLNEAGRSMELSDLCNFENKLYSFDDRTGMVVIIEEDIAYPIALLMDGNGRTDKGFKAEWCSVKDGKLYIGGMGKDWTDQQGNFVNSNPLWVKTIETNGAIAHYDWYYQYNSLREAAGAKVPGYILNEAAVWIPSEQKWIFLPRRVSKEKYDAVLDEHRCSNIGLLASEDFRSIDVETNIGPLTKTRGFSTAKFIPYRENEIVVLKTEEITETNTYIMIYDIKQNRVLLPETLIPYHLKFEGLEFI